MSEKAEKFISPKPANYPTQEQQSQIDSKFGMFIHFGMGTFTNKQISSGATSLDIFAPTAIDTAQWAEVAQRAGMKYIILVAKHCEGFAMWNTALSEYKITNSPCPIDVALSLSEECKKRGIKLGFYYCLSDDHNKDYINDYEKYFEFMCGQLTELLDGRYGDIVELWFDVTWEKTAEEWHLDKIYDMVKRLQPKCQIGCNHTIGQHGTAGMCFDEVDGVKERYMPISQCNMDPIRYFPSDFRLADPFLPSENDPKIFEYMGEGYYLPFEATICSREGFNWFYSDNYESEALKDPVQVAKVYLELIRQQNRLVINLAPNRNGKLVQADVENLFKISEYIKANI